MARSRGLGDVYKRQASVEPPQYGNARAVGFAMRNRLQAANLTHHDLILAEFADMVRSFGITIPARIYVDEYQDSAPIDASIYMHLAREGSALYLIGDPRQAIYGFRGADPTNLTQAWNIAADHPNSREILTMNFRSAAPICDFASEIAAKMPGLEFGTRMEAATTEIDASVSKQASASEPEEMLQALKWIQTLTDNGSSAAVLCRYNNQAAAMAAILRANGIRTTCSADGPTTTAARETLEESLAKIQTAILATYGIPSEMPAEDGRKFLLDLMTALAIPMANQDALLPALMACPTREAVISLSGNPEPPAGRVAVATIHAAKGLEWDAVWFLGADSAAFPDHDPEAGRLAYVAATRARRHLVISHSQARLQPESGKTLTGLQFSAWIPS
jgi:DNA helicase-2/ATP-dependent DNA helicase PcrA